MPCRRLLFFIFNVIFFKLARDGLDAELDSWLKEDDKNLKHIDALDSRKYSALHYACRYERINELLSSPGPSPSPGPCPNRPPS